MVDASDGSLAKSQRVETYLGQREGLLTLITAVTLAALVFSYVGFVRAGSAGQGPANALPAALGADGRAVFVDTGKCASCHGATGGGGVGPKLSGGAVVATFENPVDQVRWVMLGSTDGASVYQSVGKTPKGGMPGFADSLTLTQVVEVVLYERQNIAGQPLATDATLWADLRELSTEFAGKGVTDAEIEAILTRIATEGGVTIPPAP